MSTQVNPRSNSPRVNLRHIDGLDLNKTHGVPFLDDAKLAARDVSVFYGAKQALFDVSMDLGKKQVMALIGPSGCGKSTFLRCLNRMNDTIRDCKVIGTLHLDGDDINAKHADPVPVRARVGMVFQKPNPFAKSVYDNIAYGPRIHGLVTDKSEIDKLVEDCLKRVGLWDEVSDRLEQPGTALSGGQQQRLCIARTIAIQPEVILLDEPCSALDPIATGKIEELINDLASDFCIAIVTHSMQQARRIATRVAYFHMGYLVEVNDTAQLFEQPESELAKRYLSGHFG